MSAVTNSLNGSSLSYSYDELNRLKTETVSFNGKTLSHGYTYAASARGGNYTTSKTETETIGNIVYKYVYDKTGNITAIYKKAKGAADGTYKLVASYGYDSFGQLKRENVAPDVYAGYTMMYNYDNGGNITSLVKYPYTTGNLGTALSTITYSYADSNWKDKLTSINGSAITYDAIGNPLSYKGYTLKWSGRKLDSLSKSGLNVTYKYDSDGIRTSKTVNGVKYTYYYEGSQLRFEQRGNEKLYYSYNGYGHLSGITHVNSAGTVNNYYVMTNTRGDVEQIYGASGTLVAQYMYDAWGNVLAVKDGNGAVLSASANHIGNINPIRYRGYYYDVETRLYYLNSRYYDPEIGRFISADGEMSGLGETVQGYNLFAYCMNNPVNMSDESGCWPKWAETAAKVGSVVIAVAAVAIMVVAVSAVSAGTATPVAIVGASIFLGAALSGISGGVANEAKGNSYWNGYIGGATGGAIQSACSKTPAGIIIGGGAGVTVGTAITDVLNNIDPDSSNSSAIEIAKNAGTSGGKALVTSSLTAYMGYSADIAVVDGAGGLKPTFTLGHSEGIKAFFGWIDDAFVYIWE